MSFSERKGLKPIREVFQVASMDDVLRTSLWNVLHLRIWAVPGFIWTRQGNAGDIVPFSKSLWFQFFKRPIDEIPPNPYEILGVIRTRYFALTWNEVYDFIEVVMQLANNRTLEFELNDILKHEMAGYRILNRQIIDVTDQQEIDALEEALGKDQFEPVRTHLSRALELLGDRKSPDYRNSIKESISAVESIAKIITKNERATLGDALKVLEKTHKLHGALKEGFSCLYGYTSDEEGIRHAMLEEPNLDAADAKYFLISCTSFINYLKSKN